MDKTPYAIFKAGSEAVRRAALMHGITFPEDQINERCICAFMAEELHKALDVPVHTEVDYTKLASELDLIRTPQALNAVGAMKADIVIYEEGVKPLPRAIIEVKKFAEGHDVNDIIIDLHKGDPIGLAEHVPIYAGVFICETSQGIEERKRALEKAAGRRPVLFASPAPALLGGWQWCFACVSYGPHAIDVAGRAA